MKIAVLADAAQRKEWELRPVANSQVEIEWAGSVRSFLACSADAYFDLLFEQDHERTQHLLMRAKWPFFINEVTETTRKTGSDFVRICAWPGFLNRPLTEIAVATRSREKMFQPVMQALGWDYRIVPDIPGMITPRLLASIVNEAYYTWGDGVSDPAQIDLAMKLGTNYPLGPFEWSRKIGIERIYNLLKRLGRTDDRYRVAPALEQALKNSDPIR